MTGSEISATLWRGDGVRLVHSSTNKALQLESKGDRKPRIAWPLLDEHEHRLKHAKERKRLSDARRGQQTKENSAFGSSEECLLQRARPQTRKWSVGPECCQSCVITTGLRLTLPQRRCVTSKSAHTDKDNVTASHPPRTYCMTAAKKMERI